MKISSRWKMPICNVYPTRERLFDNIIIPLEKNFFSVDFRIFIHHFHYTTFVQILLIAGK
jgi:hypothetical protein